MTDKHLLNSAMHRFAGINAKQFPLMQGELPATLVIAPHDNSDLQVLPLEAMESPAIRKAISSALFTMTCLEGHMMEQRTDARFPSSDDVASHPDARHCLIYLAQASDGTRACAVQYILKPEHSAPALSPLKILDGCGVALVSSDIADMTQPGKPSRRTH